MRLVASPPELFYSRHDLEDPRLGDLVSSQSLENALADPSVLKSLHGYADDEGISLNGGRAGAALAPERIRNFLYRMTPSLQVESPYMGLADIGDLKATAGSLAEKHAFAREVAQSLHAAGKFAISLGGGHDYGYADVAGFLDVFSTKNPLVINVDAHLDVRPVRDEKFHSGTPFFRVLSEFGSRFEFWEYGLQPQCNSQTHLQWAKSRGAKILMAEECQAFTLSGHVRKDKSRPTFLSLDIDAFTNSLAPGCSQSWNGGLELATIKNLIDDLQENFFLCGVGLYEVSPPLDVADRTCKLAAEIVHDLLYPRKSAGTRVITLGGKNP